MRSPPDPVHNFGFVVERNPSRADNGYSVVAGNYFLVQIVCLTISPTFFSGAAYGLYVMLVNLIDVGASRFAPKRMAWTFVACDVISLVIQVRLFLSFVSGHGGSCLFDAGCGRSASAEHVFASESLIGPNRVSLPQPAPSPNRTTGPISWSVFQLQTKRSSSPYAGCQVAGIAFQLLVMVIFSFVASVLPILPFSSHLELTSASTSAGSTTSAVCRKACAAPCREGPSS